MSGLFAVVTQTNNINNIARRVLDLVEGQAPSVEGKSHAVFFMKYSNNALKQTNLESGAKFHNDLISQHRLDNQQELMSMLRLSAENNSSLSSQQLLRLSYLQWGTACFEKIKGSFNTILWDEKSQKLVAAIDAFSGYSLYYAISNNVLYLASDASVLAENLSIPISVNKLAVSQWLAGRPDPNISMFDGINIIPPGHCLSYSDDQGIKTQKFWDVDPEHTIHYTKHSDYTEHFLELLSSSVRHRIFDEQWDDLSTIFCQMSGGMDSTSITALANLMLSQSKERFHTLSHRYNNTKSCDESKNIDSMIATLDLKQQHFIDLDNFEQCDFSQLYPVNFDNPGIVLSPKYHQELQLIQQQGARVLLTGNGGDEMCWGHSSAFKSRLFKGDLGVINEVLSACDVLNEPKLRALYRVFMPTMLQNMLRYVRGKKSENNHFPAWLSKQAMGLVVGAEKEFINPYSSMRQPAKHARYYGLKNTSTYNSMRSYQKVANGYGVDVRHPFFDPSVVEFSFAIPDEMLIKGAFPKWLLRKTMQGYLPESVCWNKNKTVFDQHFANLIRTNKVELRQLLSQEQLQDLGLIDNKVILKAFDEVVSQRDGRLQVDLLYAILTQLWFQTHCL